MLLGNLGRYFLFKRRLFTREPAAADEISCSQKSCLTVESGTEEVGTSAKSLQRFRAVKELFLAKEELLILKPTHTKITFPTSHVQSVM